MVDPFPDEQLGFNFDIPRDDLDFVYKETRYIKDNSPSCQYIPSRKMMLKLMRACIGIENEEDLWFNNLKQ